MQKARGHPKAPTACRRTVSGTISLPYSGYFSPFPHGTSALSVFQEYLALSDGSDRFTQDFSCPALLRIPLPFIQYYLYGTFTLFGWLFQNHSSSLNNRYRGPTTPKLPKQLWFGLVPFRSPLLWESLLFSLPPGT